MTAAGEVATAGHTFEIAAGTIGKGTVAAQRITIAGRRDGQTFDMVFPFPLAEMAEHSPSYTANRAVNAVVPVCAAPPGIRTVLDLPVFTANPGRP